MGRRKKSETGEANGKVGRPEGSKNLSPEEIKAARLKRRQECEAKLTYSKTHNAGELSFYELYSGYFENNVKYYPVLLRFYTTGGICFVTCIANHNDSREYFTDIPARSFELMDQPLDAVPEHLLEIMRHNRKVLKVEWEEKEPRSVSHTERRSYILPEFVRKDGEVYDTDENGNLITRRSMRGRSHLAPERREFLDKLKEAKKNCADDEMAYEEDGKIVIRKKKKRGRVVSPERQKQLDKKKTLLEKCKDDEIVDEKEDGTPYIRKKMKKGHGGRTIDPERRQLLDELAKAKKKCKKDEMAEIVDGEVIIRKKKRLRKKVTPARRKLLDELAKAKKKCKKDQIAEIKGNKVIIRKKKKRGRPVGWKSQVTA